MEQNIISLDLSSKSTGWCIYYDNKIQSYGCLQTSSKDVIARIYYMRDNLREIVNKYNIKKAIIEEVRTDYQNIHTYKVLTWLQAAIIFMFYDIDKNIEIEFMQPSEWRNKIGIRTGKGIKREELKKADIEYVKNKYDIEENDDVCDSICLLDAYLSKNKNTGEINWE